MPSGSDLVVLSGPAMVGLVRAVASLDEAGLGRHAVIGGVAVNARLGQAHRATADVDTVVDETTPPDAVEALLALPGAQPDPTGRHRVRIHGTKVEVIGVGPIHEGDLNGIPTKDALFVASHSWALDTATPLTVIAGRLRPHRRGDRAIRHGRPEGGTRGLLDQPSATPPHIRLEDQRGSTGTCSPRLKPVWQQPVETYSTGPDGGIVTWRDYLYAAARSLAGLKWRPSA